MFFFSEFVSLGKKLKQRFSKASIVFPSCFKDTLIKKYLKKSKEIKVNKKKLRNKNKEIILNIKENERLFFINFKKI